MAKLNETPTTAASNLLEALTAAYSWIAAAETGVINGHLKGKAIQGDFGHGTIADLDAKISSAMAKARGEN